VGIDDVQELYPRGADVALAVSLNGQQFHNLGVTVNLYNPTVAPRVNSVRPASGPKEGGLLVTMDASNVANVPTLACQMMSPAGLTSAVATFVSSTTATCIVPPNEDATGQLQGGDVPITLTNGDLGAGAVMPAWSQFFRYTTTTAEVCIAEGPGVSGTVPLPAGTYSSFTIQAFAALTSGGVKARESGGDFFYVDLELDGQRLGSSLVVDLDPEISYSLEGEESILPAAWIAADTVERLESFEQIGGHYAAIYEATVAGTTRFTSVRQVGQSLAAHMLWTSCRQNWTRPTRSSRFL
jgi:hypothetical protein